MGRFIFKFGGFAIIGFWASVSNGGAILRLSEFSSDQTPAEQLDATLEFTVTGSTLTLSVTNDTAGGNSFDISEIYFNSLPHIEGLSLDSGPEEWVISLNEPADGFGRYDYGLLSALGNDPFEIAPGQTVDFQFEIFGTAPFVDTDFTSQFSTIPPGHRPALAAAHFKNGPGDDSAFGSVVIPEPATLMLLLAGASVFIRRSRSTKLR